LIPRLLASGAALASVIAEAAVTISQLYFVKDHINFIDILKQCKWYMLGAFIMFVIVYPYALYLKPGMVNTLVCACLGALIYFGVLIVVKEPLIFDFISKLRRKEF
jgi:O-antigen/teichoic acid export membrane protein